MIQETVRTDIRQASSEKDYEDARRLVRAYFETLRKADPEAERMLDAYFENHAIEAELASLPITFGYPNGACLIACADGKAVGTVMLSRKSDVRCEMNRMYVHPSARGLGLGRQLCARIIAAGREMGFHEMTLETMPFLRSAIEIYKNHGFARYSGEDPRFINLKLKL